MRGEAAAVPPSKNANFFFLSSSVAEYSSRYSSFDLPEWYTYDVWRRQLVLYPLPSPVASALSAPPGPYTSIVTAACHLLPIGPVLIISPPFPNFSGSAPPPPLPTFG